MTGLEIGLVVGGCVFVGYMLSQIGFMVYFFKNRGGRC